MAHIVMAYIVMAYAAVAYIVMAYIVTAYVVMAYLAMATSPGTLGSAYIVMTCIAYIVMTPSPGTLRSAAALGGRRRHAPKIVFFRKKNVSPDSAAASAFAEASACA